MMFRFACAFAFLVSAAMIFSCKHDPQLLPSGTGYPFAINKIISTKCAISGCHTDRSKGAAGGISLQSWSAMMQGGDGGAVVIPYRSNRSLLHLYTNTFSDIGLSLHPTMPVNGTPLSREDVLTLKSWIDNGAPNDLGQIAFSDPNLSKFYVTDQGCDEVAVIDAKSGLAMRYISVGVSPAGESPHAVKISPDKRYAYITFAQGTAVQKIDCHTDQVVGTVDVGFGLWNSIVVSPDGTTGVITDWQSTSGAVTGHIAFLDLTNMTLIKKIGGLELAHGLAASLDFKTIYATHSSGSDLYKFDISDLSNINQSNITIASASANLGEHDIILSPDGSKYFVTCSLTNEVRAMQTSNDSVIAILPTGTFPQEFAVSQSHPYLFVTCQNDPTGATQDLGSVYVFDYDDLQFIKKLSGALYQPHGLAVDDKENIALVANRNLDGNGPAPHHTTECGRPGFLRMIDMNTLEFKNGYSPELSADPYGAAARVIW